MKEKCYDWVFKHKKLDVKLKFRAPSFEKAIEILGFVVSQVDEWNMYKFKCK